MRPPPPPRRPPCVRVRTIAAARAAGGPFNTRPKAPTVTGVTFVTGEPGDAVADASSVAALWRAAAPVPGVSGVDENRVATALSGTWSAVAAYATVDGRRVLIGIARVVSDGVFAALLVDVAVAPGWRGRGVGRALVARVTADARARGASSVVAFVPPGKSRLFFQRCGFRVSAAYRMLRHVASEG
jgi:GNAT superfamily N-acetyltransferase